MYMNISGLTRTTWKKRRLIVTYMRTCICLGWQVTCTIYKMAMWPVRTYVCLSWYFLFSPSIVWKSSRSPKEGCFCKRFPLSLAPLLGRIGNTPIQPGGSNGALRPPPPSSSSLDLLRDLLLPPPQKPPLTIDRWGRPPVAVPVARRMSSGLTRVMLSSIRAPPPPRPRSVLLPQSLYKIRAPSPISVQDPCSFFNPIWIRYAPLPRATSKGVFQRLPTNLLGKAATDGSRWCPSLNKES
jgi:hypothetical protein